MSFALAAFVALALTIVTSLLTYEAMRVAWRFMVRSRRRQGRVLYSIAAAIVAHLISIGLYALTYDVFATTTDVGTLHDATSNAAEPFSFLLTLYFSAATYTTLGFGDVLPTGDLRLLAVIESLNGLVLIGWSVAHSFLAMEEFWDKPQLPRK